MQAAYVLLLYYNTPTRQFFDPFTGARKTVTRGVNIENADYHGKVSNHHHYICVYVHVQ